jgi:medium-chain acyl-[acyl-carrier-protein] hydrolase
MKQIFEKTFEVHDNEVLSNRLLNPVKLVDYMNEIAGYHSESAGYSMATLFRKGYSWIVLSWNIGINRLPELGDTIKIETWISEIKRCFAYREHLVKNEQGEILSKASSRWIFYNISKQRPERIPLQLAANWQLKPVTASPISIMDSEILKGSNFINKEKNFAVQKQDIDILDHVHNSKYIDWVVGSKPEFIKEDYSLKHLQISYEHEIKYPAVIVVKQKLFPQENKSQYLIYDEICDNSKQKVFSKIATQWSLSV